MERLAGLDVAAVSQPAAIWPLGPACSKPPLAKPLVVVAPRLVGQRHLKFLEHIDNLLLW